MLPQVFPDGLILEKNDVMLFVILAHVVYFVDVYVSMLLINQIVTHSQTKYLQNNWLSMVNHYK